MKYESNAKFKACLLACTALLILFFIPEKNSAQSNVILSQGEIVNLKNPEITAMMRYIEQPVDISTGIPDINVPIYTIKTNNLTFPISINYHAGGIKVDQQSTVVGLGWSLNAGGIVTQVVRDFSDGQFGTIDFSKIPLLDPDWQTDILRGNYYTYPYKNDGTIDQQALIVHNQRFTDKEPDIYTISAPGLSGIISLSNRNEFVHYTLDPFHIVQGIETPWTSDQLIFKNKVGTTYIFGKNFLGFNYKDTTSVTTSYYSTNFNELPLPDRPATHSYTWYLNSIISADLSDTIKIDYIKRDNTDYFCTSIT